MVRVAGGFLAAISGVLGIGGAFTTLAVSGIVILLGGPTNRLLIAQGWLGLAVSLMIILLSLISAASESRTVPVLLSATGLVGLVCGHYVAPFAFIAFTIGLVTTLVSWKRPEEGGEQHVAPYKIDRPTNAAPLHLSRNNQIPHVIEIAYRGLYSSN